MLPASEMLIPIYNAKSARKQEKDDVGEGVKKRKEKKWDAGVEEREKKKREKRRKVKVKGGEKGKMVRGS